MTTSEHLRAARALIEDEDHWCEDDYGRHADGFGVAISRLETAVQHCALGASMCVVEPAGRRVMVRELCSPERRLNDAAQELFGCCVVEVNDDLGHAAVMRMYDRAIELAEAEESVEVARELVAA